MTQEWAGSILNHSNLFAWRAIPAKIMCGVYAVLCGVYAVLCGVYAVFVVCVCSFCRVCMQFLWCVNAIFVVCVGSFCRVCMQFLWCV